MPDIEECCDDTPLEGVLELELGSEVRSVSMAWGFGLLGGLEFDMVDGGRDAGKDEREVLRGAPTLPCELGGGRGGGGAGSVVVDTLRLVVGCCRAILVALVLWYIGRLVWLLAILPSSSSSSYHALVKHLFLWICSKMAHYEQGEGFGAWEKKPERPPCNAHTSTERWRRFRFKSRRGS